MRNVRVLYEKTGRMKFISHLDMTRLMTRIIRKSKLPIWYTEGFNRRVYLSFALPLSLGFESVYEILDFKLQDDSVTLETVPDLLNSVSPEGLRFYECFEAEKKAVEVSFARFEITFCDGGQLKDDFENFLKSDTIPCEKRTKKGDIKAFDFKECIKDLLLSKKDGNTLLALTLPAGNSGNINPELLLNKYFDIAPEYYCYKTVRTCVFDGKMQKFR